MTDSLKKTLKRCSPSKLLQIGGVALCYFLVARLSLLLMFKDSNVSPVWPPTGIALAVTFIWGYRILPGVFLGAFFANLTSFAGNNVPLFSSLLMSLMIGIGNTLEAFVGVQFLLLIKGTRTPFHQLRNVLKFILISTMAASFIGATVGGLTIYFGGVISASDFPYLLLTRWAGDASGALLFAPLIIFWSSREPFLLHRKLGFELFLFSIILIALSTIIFILPVRQFEKVYEYQYLPVLAVLWSCFRFDKRIVAVHLLTINLFAVFGAVSNNYTFSSLNSEILYLQLYLATLSILMLTYTTTVSQEKYSRANLIKSQTDLRLQVQELKKSQAQILQIQSELEKKNVALNSSRRAALSIMQDMNQQKQKVQELLSEFELSNSALKVEKEKSEAANQAKSEFLANMSHEIRTPMNAVLGFTEILKGLEKDPKKAHFVDNIQTSGKALLHLINDILDLSKIEAGKIDLQYSVLSIRELVDEMRTVLGHKIEEKGLQLLIEVNESIPDSLLLDETRLRQVLVNLIGNAVKFTESGYIKIKATGYQADTEAKSQYNLEIIIKDTGIGIPADQQEQIFGVFEQVKGQKTSQFGGTGLGLAIAKRLIEMMDGEIEVESVIGKGTSFIIRLNQIEVAAATSVLTTSITQNTLDALIFDPATILIADDIDYNRELISTLLEPHSFEFMYAENGKDTIELAQKEQPDLILLDMRMPVLDGYEASEELKADKRTKNIPIIAITASALKQDEERCRNACDGYLSKPVTKSALTKEVMKFLPYKITSSET